MSEPVVRIDPLLPADDAERFVERTRHFGEYRLYAEHERLELPIGPGLLPRHDAVANYLRTRVRPGESVAEVGARTSYFREEFAYGDREFLPGIAEFRDHPVFVEAAQLIHGRPVIEPSIVYANLMLPGQELALHTDVPEFRGLNRKVVPQWLLVVMHHSGLFDRYRLPIATAIAYFGDTRGGDLVYWPEGSDAPPRRLAAEHNTAVVLDTDSVFHGVAAVDGARELPPLGDGTRLVPRHGRVDLVDAAAATVATYEWDTIRFSVSWKAYCFADAAERDRWRNHDDDLHLDVVLDALVADLRTRDVHIGSTDPKLGAVLIDEYVRFPIEAV